MYKEAEVIDLAKNLRANELECVIRYMIILVRMKKIRNQKAEELNSQLQSIVKPGGLLLTEVTDIMDKIEAALNETENKQLVE